MFKLENDQLIIAAIEKGAELTSIKGKKPNIEYLWQADPTFWAKHSPILFPIVGTLKNDTYFIGEEKYQLPRHGFARNRNFQCISQTADSLVFELTDDEESFAVYPYHFVFRVTYRLSANRLETHYTVRGRKENDLYFSVGGHPAFNVPMDPATSFEDWRLEFNQEEKLNRFPIVSGGLLNTEPISVTSTGKSISLTKELFAEDALVFKHLRAGSVKLVSDKSRHGLEFHFGEFPYLGIWAAKNAPFVCIEPWAGIADSVSTNQQLTNKEGIVHLRKGEQFEKSWSADFF